MARSDEQRRNLFATVEGMVNGAGQVMQRLHPEMKIRSWNELTDTERQKLAAAFAASLPPLGTILSGRPINGAQDTGVVFGGD